MIHFIIIEQNPQGVNALCQSSIRSARQHAEIFLKGKPKRSWIAIGVVWR